MRGGRSGPYLRRILALYLLWMTIYLPIYGPDLTGAGHALQTLVFGYFHLWFLPGLLVSAVMVMVLRRPMRIAVAAALLAGTGLALQLLVLTGRQISSWTITATGSSPSFRSSRLAFCWRMAGVRGCGGGPCRWPVWRCWR